MILKSRATILSRNAETENCQVDVGGLKLFSKTTQIAIKRIFFIALMSKKQFATYVKIV